MEISKIEQEVLTKIREQLNSLCGGREICKDCPFYKTISHSDYSGCLEYAAVKVLVNEMRNASKDSEEEVKPSGDDPVNHPSHYTQGKIEVINYIEDKEFGYHLGNAIKYISRAGKKDPNKTIEDLEKAEWYLKRYIELLKKDK